MKIMKKFIIFILISISICLYRNTEYLRGGDTFKNSINLLPGGFGFEKNGKININITMQTSLQYLSQANLFFAVFPYDTYVNF